VRQQICREVVLVIPAVNFYPRDALHSAVFAGATCPSVCHTPVLCLNG